MVYSSMGLWHHVRGPCPHQGLDPHESSGRPQLRKVAITRSTSRGLCGGTSSGRQELVSSDPLERLNGVLAMTSPRKAELRSCIVLGLKPMGKLITLDKYLSVRLNQGLAWSSDLSL